MNFQSAYENYMELFTFYLLLVKFQSVHKKYMKTRAFYFHFCLNFNLFIEKNKKTFCILLSFFKKNLNLFKLVYFNSN